MGSSIWQSVKNVFVKNPNLVIDNEDVDRKVKADADGWLRVNGQLMDVVKEIKKVPGLRYKVEEHDHGYSTSKVVYVTDTVGRLIELYLQFDGEYASMPLNEFIQKALPKAWTDSGI